MFEIFEMLHSFVNLRNNIKIYSWLKYSWLNIKLFESSMISWMFCRPKSFKNIHLR